MLELAGYTINASLPKVKNEIRVENGIATIKRDDKVFTVKYSDNVNWQKELKESMIKNGIDDGVARNVCYKTSLQIKSIE